MTQNTLQELTAMQQLLMQQSQYGDGITGTTTTTATTLSQQQYELNQYNLAMQAAQVMAVPSDWVKEEALAEANAEISALQAKLEDRDAQLDLARDEINMLKEILAEREETIEALAADNESLRDGKAIEPDADGWIEWDYMGRDRNACPVPGKEIAVWLARNRGLEKNQENWSQADYYNWGDCGSASIIAYKVLS